MEISRYIKKKKVPKLDLPKLHVRHHELRRYARKTCIKQRKRFNYRMNSYSVHCGKLLFARLNCYTTIRQVKFEVLQVFQNRFVFLSVSISFIPLATPFRYCHWQCRAEHTLHTALCGLYFIASRNKANHSNSSKNAVIVYAAYSSNEFEKKVLITAIIKLVLSLSPAKQRDLHISDALSQWRTTLGNCFTHSGNLDQVAFLTSFATNASTNILNPKTNTMSSALSFYSILRASWLP